MLTKHSGKLNPSKIEQENQKNYSYPPKNYPAFSCSNNSYITIENIEEKDQVNFQGSRESVTT